MSIEHDTERPPASPTLPAPEMPAPAALAGRGRVRIPAGMLQGQEERLRLMKAAAALHTLEVLDRAMRQGWDVQLCTEKPFTDTPVRAWASHHSHVYRAESGEDLAEATRKLAALLEPLLQVQP